MLKPVIYLIYGNGILDIFVDEDDNGILDKFVDDDGNGIFVDHDDNGILDIFVDDDNNSDCDSIRFSYSGFNEDNALKF